MVENGPCLRCAVLLISLAACAASAFGYPPAPAFTIVGVVRDSFGWAIRSTDNARLVIKKGNVVVSDTVIDERQKLGENFRVLIPMDLRPSDAYTQAARLPGDLVQFEVRYQQSILLVTSATVSQRSIGQPAGILRVDLTVGEDSDGDGIPDAWEWWQLAESGLDPSLFNLNILGNGDFDGDGTPDYLEYLAGTYAFLASESLNLAVESVRDGWVDLRTFVVVDKAYQIESSTNFSDWSVVEVWPEGVGGSGTFWTAADTRETRVSVRRASGEAGRFYRMSVRR